MFTRVSGLKKGYDPDEVDDFFEHARDYYEGRTDEPLTHRDIHTCVFDVMYRGYDTDQVDAALNRLENAFVAKERQEIVAQQGQDQWSNVLNERARTMYPRLTRPAGEKFSHPRRGYGYASDEVDALCANLVKFFDGKIKVTADDLRVITFKRAKGKNAYDEGSVDAFMARGIEVLLGVES
ncbi:DivIVA domain-containing protein [Timonella sp. A28]|uniref:DivIVA domain-containing protein n=1 Tax=Timonella sp. A28 TaxID=3442640 RepID=UPI003EBCA054